MSLSFLRMATTSSVIDFTRTSGGSCWACARGISNAKSRQKEIFIETGFRLFGGFIIGVLTLPRGIAVVDEVASALQPGFAHERVLVERRLLDNARSIEQVATVGDRARPVEGVMHGNSVDIEHEIRPRVQQQAETVADRGGTQDRQDQVPAAAGSPPGPGLAGIPLLPLAPQPGSE